jgi:hypothetical protein
LVISVLFQENQFSIPQIFPTMFTCSKLDLAKLALSKLDSSKLALSKLALANINQRKLAFTNLVNYNMRLILVCYLSPTVGPPPLR